MEKVCKFLREHGMQIINFRKTAVKLLTKEQQESYQNTKICYFCKEIFENKYAKDKKYHKIGDNRHYTGEYGGHLKYSVSKKVPYAFYNRSSYDYYFIILSQFSCLGENTENLYSSNRKRNYKN